SYCNLRGYVGQCNLRGCDRIGHGVFDRGVGEGGAGVLCSRIDSTNGVETMTSASKNPISATAATTVAPIRLRNARLRITRSWSLSREHNVSHCFFERTSAGACLRSSALVGSSFI